MTEEPRALAPTPNLAGAFWSSGSMGNRRMVLRPWRRSRVRKRGRGDSACLRRMGDPTLTPWITIICNGEWRWRDTARNVDQRGAYATANVDIP